MLSTIEKEDFFITSINPNVNDEKHMRTQINTPPVVKIYAGKGCAACALCVGCWFNLLIFAVVASGGTIIK